MSAGQVVQRAARRPAIAAATLLAVYVLLSLLMDPRGSLGTDTGAKVATLEVMERNGTTDPDVGYWAEALDPRGTVHPYYQALHTEDGGWVAVTTQPMLQAARPLYDLGGYRLALLLPMLGSIACAFGARAIVRRTSADDGWAAFWVIGLASPVLLYGLDLWEHSLGVAAIVGAVALLLDVAAERPGWWRALAAGALLGAAATMRTESFVYAVIAVGATCGSLALGRHRWRVALLAGLLAVVGFAGPWVANRALEEQVGAISRAERSVGAASAGGSKLGARIDQSLVTTFGLKGEGAGSVVIGLAVLLAVGLALRAERRGDRQMAIIAMVLAGLPYLVSAVTDLSFVPGMLVAFPLAVAAFFVRPTGPRALALGIAVGALPLVWAFQYVGGGGPQWGSRYTLATTVVLGALATVQLGRRFPIVSRGLLVGSALLAVLSLVWLGIRSRSVDDLFHQIASVDADVVIARDGFLIREGGVATVGKHWLSTDSDRTFATAVEVAIDSGAARVAVLEYGGDAPPASAIPAGWRAVHQERGDLTGDPIGIVVYELP